LSIPFADADRALVTVVFHTTAIRNSQFEVKIEVPFLKEGAFVGQSVTTYPTVRAIRKLGVLNATQLAEVEALYSSGSVGLRRSISFHTTPKALEWSRPLTHAAGTISINPTSCRL
jgi:hypothetical protein